MALAAGFTAGVLATLAVVGVLAYRKLRQFRRMMRAPSSASVNGVNIPPITSR